MWQISINQIATLSSLQHIGQLLFVTLNRFLNYFSADCAQEVDHGGFSPTAITLVAIQLDLK